MSCFLASERLAVFVAAQAADADERRPCDGFQQQPRLPPKLEAASRSRVSAPQHPKASANCLPAACRPASASQDIAIVAAIAAARPAEFMLMGAQTAHTASAQQTAVKR